MNQTDIIILILGAIVICQQVIITKLIRRYNNLKIDFIAGKEAFRNFTASEINNKLEQYKKETLWAKEAQDMLDHKESTGNFHISDECYKELRQKIVDEIFYVGKEITSLEDPSKLYGGEWEHPNIRDNTTWKRIK